MSVSCLATKTQEVTPAFVVSEAVLLTDPRTPRERALEIVDQIATQYGITREAMFERTTVHRVARPRQEAMHAIRAMGWNFPRIARFFGMKNHTTVMHGIRNHLRRQALNQANAA